MPSDTQAVIVRPREAAFLPEMPLVSAEDIENALTVGDMAKMSPAVRIRYYQAICLSAGLNPLTRPFTLLKDQSGQVIPYANKDCAEQLRKRDRLSIRVVSREKADGLYIITVQASSPDGRVEDAQGIVDITSLKGQALANAMMKAETKAKRRVTMALCGLGFPLADDAEPGAKPVHMTWQTGTLDTEATTRVSPEETPPAHQAIEELFDGRTSTATSQPVAQDARDPLTLTRENAAGTDASFSRPAGQGGASYIAQIEAVLAAQKGNLEAFWGWAEVKLGKKRETFSVNDLVALLTRAREQAGKKRGGKPTTAAVVPTEDEAPPVETMDPETGELLEAPEEADTLAPVPESDDEEPF